MERSSSSFSLISHFPTLKRHLHDDAPSVGHPSLNASRPAIHQRSLVAIPPRVTLSKMQQANQSNLHEAGIGVPSRLCSVCGDISTGTLDFHRVVIDHHLRSLSKEYTSVVIAVKVVRLSFADRFNVFAFKITNVPATVSTPHHRVLALDGCRW